MMHTHRLLAVLLLAFTPLALGGPGHDHDRPDTPPTTSSLQRFPDGRVFLPKPAQRQLGVRTVRLEAATLSRAIELAGKVSMDPNSSGKVQAVNAGRIQAGPRGLPNSGEMVSKGQVLAWVLTAASPLEKSAQAATLAELKASHTLTEKRLVRLQALADTVPRKDIEAAESELQSLVTRIDALTQGQGNREPLIAPVSGVIASARAVAGQVVDARELVFEVVDPSRFQVEAQSYDTELAGHVDAAFLAVGGERLPLIFLGAARSLREQALPLHFRLQTQVPQALALGQPVKVVVQTKEQIKGIAVPQAALMKNPANQTILWVKTAPEIFAPRVVTTVPLDGQRIAVVSGLESGERVVTEGASLINQVR